MEYLFDTHTHSDYSHDGIPALEELVKAAISKGLKYLAITDHCDKDCVALPGFEWVRQIDLVSRKAEMTALKQKYAGEIYIADSLEYGYAPEADALYLDVQNSYPTDYVINSVHIVEGIDVYFREYFDSRTKADAIGHLGYIARCSTYPEKKLYYSDFPDLIDAILKAVINKGKSLEINTASKGTKCDLFHDTTILKRYKQLGGELITFGSDAHEPSRLCADFEEAEAAALSCGFRYAFVYSGHKPSAVKLGS